MPWYQCVHAQCCPPMASRSLVAVCPSRQWAIEYRMWKTHVHSTTRKCTNPSLASCCACSSPASSLSFPSPDSSPLPDPLTISASKGPFPSPFFSTLPGVAPSLAGVVGTVLSGTLGDGLDEDGVVGISIGDLFEGEVLSGGGAGGVEGRVALLPIPLPAFPFIKPLSPFWNLPFTPFIPFCSIHPFAPSPFILGGTPRVPLPLPDTFPLLDSSTMVATRASLRLENLQKHSYMLTLCPTNSRENVCALASWMGMCPARSDTAWHEKTLVIGLVARPDTVWHGFWNLRFFLKALKNYEKQYICFQLAAVRQSVLPNISVSHAHTMLVESNPWTLLWTRKTSHIFFAVYESVLGVSKRFYLSVWT